MLIIPSFMQGGWSAGVFTASSRDLTALAQSITTCLALPSQSAKTSFLSLLNQHSISKTTTYRKYKAHTFAREGMGVHLDF